jgi:hypothetical protein
MNDNYDDMDITQSFVFSSKQGTTTNVKQETYPDGITWPVVLESFLNFLEASGYIGVKNKVRIQENPFTESDWTLGTFEKAYWE